tara:strand:- start:77 stop:769 length:693 start_codon:yes stop_codon:yes gene_type:complete
MSKNSISIIIPVLNEEKRLPFLLSKLLKRSVFENEIIIVDGGSKDKTIRVLKKYSYVRIFNCKKGRAIQMNYGALNASNEILYFIHADTIPPKKFDKLIFNSFEKGNTVGCFRLSFEGSNFFLKISAFFTRFNFKICRGGDQSLYISKNMFNKLSGFNETYTYCEDVEFIDRIYKTYSFKVLPKKVITSSRRFIDNGTIKLQFHFAIIHFIRLLGASPIVIKNYYQSFIK